MNFWKQICWAVSDKIWFEVFSPIWSHVNENEKKIVKKKKSKLQNFEKEKKWSGDMVKRYFSTKFGINLLDRF